MTKVILLVDDSAQTREMYALRLRQDGYGVMEAEDGQMGVQVATEHRPDLIFMNMSLPKLDGWSAIERLRQNEGTARIPIIALTGFDEDNARTRAEEAGSSGFIGKPCEPSRLSEEVQRWLGPGSSSTRGSG